MSEQMKRKFFILSGGREIMYIYILGKNVLYIQRNYVLYILGKNACTENTPKKKKTNLQLLESGQINPSNLPDKKNKATIQIKYSD